MDLCTIDQLRPLLSAQAEGGYPNHQLGAVLRLRVNVQLAAHHFIYDNGTGNRMGARLGQGDVLRTDAQNHTAAVHRLCRQIFTGLTVHLNPASERRHIVLAVLPHQLRAEGVHLGRADEARHEQIHWMLKYLRGGANLLDEAVLHDDDPVAERHGLGLVMGYIDKGRVDLFPQENDFGTHLIAELGVQVGQRLIHQKHLGIPNHGTTDGHTLPLAAGQRPGLPCQIFGNAQHLRRFRDASEHLIVGNLLQTKAESHVLKHRQVRVQGVVLEHHGDVPILGLEVVDHHTVDLHGTLGDFLQTRDHPQGRGFAAAGGADEDHKFLILDVQVEIVNGHDLLVVDLLDVG